MWSFSQITTIVVVLLLNLIVGYLGLNIRDGFNCFILQCSKIEPEQKAGEQYGRDGSPPFYSRHE